MGNSFDNTRISNENQKTRTSINMSKDSGLESEANMRALTESLDSAYAQNETESTKARQEMLQFAEKALAEKRAIATQLDLLKDK